MRTRGAPPKNLTGQMPVSVDHSPWWAQVESDLCSTGGLDGKVVSVDELTQMVPSYPDGRRPRPRTVVRRLRRILEVVERGPNGSLSRGSTFRIVAAHEKSAIELPPSADASVDVDEDWLLSSIERMTGGK